MSLIKQNYRNRQFLKYYKRIKRREIKKMKIKEGGQRNETKK